MKISRILLAGGIAIPLLYAATLAGAGLLYPGYRHVVQAPSELGAAAAPWPEVFNIGMVATALAAIAGAAGLVPGLRERDAGGVLPALTGLSLALLGASMAMAGLFPLPSPLHYGFGLTMAGLLTPLLGALALRRGDGPGATCRLLMLAFVAGAILLALNLGAGALTARPNAGLWLRALASVCFPAIGLLCWKTRRLVDDTRSRPPGAPGRHDAFMPAKP